MSCSNSQISDQVDSLVEKFACAVECQGKCIAVGNYALGNAEAKKYVAAFKNLTQYGDVGRSRLEQLFTHPSADVRVMSASFLLRFSGDKAKIVLKRESKSKGMAAFSAQEALRRWADGSWELDPE